MSDKIIIGSTVYAEPETIGRAVARRLHPHDRPRPERATTAPRCGTAVDATVRQMLDFDNVDFGTRVSIGQIYRAALAVQGVEWVELEWLNTSEPVDDTDPANGDTTPVLAAVVYQHDNSTTMGDPGNRHYRRNDNANPTAFAFNLNDDQGLQPNLMGLQIGDHLIYRPVQDVASWMSFVVTTVPVNNTSWIQVNVSRLDEADTITAPGNNDKVMFSAIRYLPTPDSLGGVTDIETPELLIPRITPAAPILTANLTNAALTANVVTLTTATDHTMVVGNTIEVVGATNTTFNGQYTITSVPTEITLTYAKTNADIPAANSAGTVKTVNLPESEVDYPDLYEDGAHPRWPVGHRRRRVAGDVSERATPPSVAGVRHHRTPCSVGSARRRHHHVLQRGVRADRRGRGQAGDVVGRGRPDRGWVLGRPGDRR